MSFEDCEAMLLPWPLLGDAPLRSRLPVIQAAAARREDALALRLGCELARLGRASGGCTFAAPPPRGSERLALHATARRAIHASSAPAGLSASSFFWAAAARHKLHKAQKVISKRQRCAAQSHQRRAAKDSSATVICISVTIHLMSRSITNVVHPGPPANTKLC